MLHAIIDKTIYAEVLAKMSPHCLTHRCGDAAVHEGRHPKYGYCILFRSSNGEHSMASFTETYPPGTEVYDTSEELEKMHSDLLSSSP